MAGTNFTLSPAILFLYIHIEMIRNFFDAQLTIFHIKRVVIFFGIIDWIIARGWKIHWQKKVY